jgi:diphthamide biosynthesis protein 2
MASDLTAPPVLSTPVEHILQETTPIVDTGKQLTLAEDELRELYEIDRTARDIRDGGWTRVALQFPDLMLRDASWVVGALEAALLQLEDRTVDEAKQEMGQHHSHLPESPSGRAGVIERLYVLADTSYSACCIDEIAAEHVDAQVVVHYGRACLSPTSRLPVIYVFTKQSLDLDTAATAFEKEFPDKGTKVVMLADIAYQHHCSSFVSKLTASGYSNLVSSEVVRDQSSTIPNRRLVRSADGYELGTDLDMKEYALFHISTPPSALLLALHSRVKSLHILTTGGIPATDNPTDTTGALLRRRFARVLALATAGVIGILVNTLSVSNYLSSINLLRSRIAKAGKKSYTVVVGKLNSAKLANFAEVDGWVVVGCWESGLVEEDTGFFRPVVTPFELDVALMPESERVWGLEWWGGIEKLKEPRENGKGTEPTADDGSETADFDESIDGVEGDESAPPEFDLRTGKLVSHSRPMRTISRSQLGEGNGLSASLVKRQTGEVVTVNGVASPGAEFLRSHRTWQGLGSDFSGHERSTLVEEGRSGVARGYMVGQDEDHR